ncbi:hypothetical protein Afil01_21480 [Actinorhabdospora filicis]|uniref:Uncharacterized protein n=1 Tax=Actinorhabdospora filicis TaxID=1785913 RepID=A0A9W6SKF1_9ACTN|nr:hypothetical protein Afil01_21480 [Actinorhabdospora filicis]
MLEVLRLQPQGRAAEVELVDVQYRRPHGPSLEPLMGFDDVSVREAHDTRPDGIWTERTDVSSL